MKKQPTFDTPGVWAQVAHKIRNPMTSIFTSGQILQMKLADDPANRELADIVVAETERLDRMIETMDWLFRPMTLSPADVDLGRCLDGAAALLDIGPGVAVAREYGSSPVVVEGDREKIGRILANLVANAAEAAGPDGAIRMQVGACREGGRVTIVDDGPGLCADTAADPFAPFQSTKQGHLGLGLAVADRLARMHGGTIRLLPQSPRGLAAELTLPKKPGRRGGEGGRHILRHPCP